MLLSLKGLESANNFHPSVDKIKKKKIDLGNLAWLTLGSTGVRGSAPQCQLGLI